MGDQVFFFLDGSKKNNAIFNTFVPYEKSLPCTGHRYQTIQSCNGLICCRTAYCNPTKYIRDPSTNLCKLIPPPPPTFYVYNPSTKHYKILLPPPSKKYGFKEVSNVSLAFDPHKSPHYEVIAIWGDTTDGVQAEIYSSKSESWKDLGIISVCRRKCGLEDCGVFWNGALHWFNKYCSLYFDISQKLLKQLPKPDKPKEDLGHYKSWVVYFGECNGHMHLIKTYRVDVPTSLYILELRKDYSAWNVKYKVNIEHLTAAYKTEFVLNIHDCFEELDFSVLFVEDNDDDNSEDGESKTSNLVIHVSEHIIFYDLKDMSFKEVKDVHLRKKYPWHRLATPFIESLACV
ncbi:F-box protein At5g07610-like [Papaver somniferum]|uniref:F-box protein At5g07610-like n=1 Tax=Papaver somniferum TaxID=3469 RepID=UPI000E6F545D|nr:F-box protein At5g07610-like [Papaver somniferum]